MSRLVDEGPGELKDAGPSAPAFDPRYKIRRLTDYPKLPAMRWCVDRVVPQGQTTVFVGDPKCGKSYIVLSIAYAVSAGLAKWCEFNVRSGSVLYIAAEGHDGMLRRAKALEIVHKRRGNIGFIDHAINLLDPNEVNAAIDAIEEQAVRPDLLVVDTLRRAAGTGSENDAVAMKLLFDGIDRIRDRFPGLTVIVIHHNRKGDKTYSGSTAIPANADAMILVEASGDQVKIHSDEMRDGKSLEPLAIAFEQGVMVETEDGWETQRAVKGRASILDAPMTDIDPPKPVKESNIVVAALRSFEPRAATFGEWLKETARQGVGKTPFNRIRPKLVKEGIVVEEPGGPSDGRARVVYRLAEGPVSPGSVSVPVSPLRGAENRTETNRSGFSSVSTNSKPNQNQSNLPAALVPDNTTDALTSPDLLDGAPAVSDNGPMTGEEAQTMLDRLDELG